MALDIEENEDMLEEGEAICLSLTPQLHALMLARNRRRSSCCPQLFERANDKWWNPRFDSDILENQYVHSSFPKLTQRLRHALGFLVIACIIWTIYWIFAYPNHAGIYIAASLLIAAVAIGLIVFSYRNIYERYQILCSCSISTLLMISILLPFGFQIPWNHLQATPSLVTLFIFYVKVVLVVYTMLPLPPYISVLLNVSFTVVLEALISFVAGDQAFHMVCVRFLLYLCVHIIGFHVMIMNEVRMRGTFMSIGQSLLVRRQLEIEKALKEKMIHSVMPRKVADWLMKEAHNEDVDEFSTSTDFGRKGSASKNMTGGNDIRLAAFRPFNMNSMDNVSILFADIVGFTKMSSNKSAEHLVGLLNDLFGRFDNLCVRTHCEKISTLGDCYYCVSGCPTPRHDHASCCVNMGLAMIKAIKQFDEDNDENVDMRVGVHTGKVLCGIVGTKRFKFDVWSSDVTLANTMESTGKPGQVHISEVTRSFLPADVFAIEEGSPIEVSDTTMPTYFISEKIKVEPSLDVHLVVPTQQTLLVEVSDQQEQRCTSMPNMIEGFPVKEQLTTNSKKPAYTFSPNVDSLIKKLPRFTKSERPKSKTRSLPKISSKMEIVPQKLPPDQKSSSSKSMQEASKKHKLAPPISCSTPASPLAPPTPSFPFPSTVPADVKDPRKDSGIRSHRSSIQIFSMNGLSTGDLLSHRVSDYFTSSHTSLNENKRNEDCSFSATSGLSPVNACERRFQRMRKQSDLQMIKCVEQERTSLPYVMVTPLSPLTLRFTDGALERKYQQIAHCSRKDEPRTLATTYYNTYFDVVMSTVIFTCIGVALMLLFGVWWLWLVAYVVLVAVHVALLALCTYKIKTSSKSVDWLPTATRLYDRLTTWCPWHVCGGVLLCLPFAAVFANVHCNHLNELDSARYLCCIAAVSLIYFCNFTQLNCWMKNLLGSTCVIVYLVLLLSPVCPCPVLAQQCHRNSSWHGNATSQSQPEHYSHVELGLSFVLLLSLVWLLNREFEIAYRLSFYGYLMAIKDKARVQTMKDQAEWLLHNIIPKDVANVIKTMSKYSQNHSNVGVMFASIYNFNELYNEDYMGGKEFLRILNELVADIDELLNRDDFENIEKIKTIGSTYMAAAGLSPHVRNANVHLHQQLYELVQFAKEMHKVIDNFNQNLIGFNLMLRVGINYGDVTAGVIGTTKLYYDIWGDTVNIASRMDSTGVPNRIQVSGPCAQILKQKYTLEPRGQVFVKGKDNMDVFLLSNDDK